MYGTWWYIRVGELLSVIPPFECRFAFLSRHLKILLQSFHDFFSQNKSTLLTALHHITQLNLHQETQSNMEISPETHSVGILAARLASTIQGFDDYERNQLQQVQQQLVVKAAQEPIPGFFCESIVAIDTIDWKVGKQFLESEALVLVRRSDKE